MLRYLKRQTYPKYLQDVVNLCMKSSIVFQTVVLFRSDLLYGVFAFISFSFILRLCKGNSITHYREERFMIHSWMQALIFLALIKPKIHRLSLFCCHFTIYAFKPSQGMYREKKLTCLWAMKFFMRFQKCAPYLHQVSVMSLGNMEYLRKNTLTILSTEYQHFLFAVVPESNVIVSSKFKY